MTRPDDTEPSAEAWDAANELRQYLVEPESQNDIRSVALALDRFRAAWVREELPRYRHKKRGTTYQLIGEAQVQANNMLSENELVVVYRAESDGSLWVRPYYEFNDGRFEPLPEPPHDL